MPNFNAFFAFHIKILKSKAVFLNCIMYCKFLKLLSKYQFLTNASKAREYNLLKNLKSLKNSSLTLLESAFTEVTENYKGK